MQMDSWVSGQGIYWGVVPVLSGQLAKTGRCQLPSRKSRELKL